MKAVSLVRSKEVRDDGAIVEIVIWQVPEPVAPSTHSYKYRLYFGTYDEARIRYDNERGKGDHRHLGSAEYGYVFTTLEQLLDDFESDVLNWSAE